MDWTIIILISASALLLLGGATGGLLGLGAYFLLALLVVLWDVYAALRTLALRASPLGGLRSPVNVVVVPCHLLVVVVWGALGVYLWEAHRAWYAAAYAAAAVATAALLLRAPATRRMRSYLTLVYDIVGALALAAWAACDWNADAGVLTHASAMAWGDLQEVLFSHAALLAPIFILPPMLVLEPRPPTGTEGEGGGATGAGAPDGPRGAAHPRARPRPAWRRAASLGLDASLGAVTAILLLFLPLCTGAVLSVRDLPSPADVEYTSRPGFEFAATGRTFTEVLRAPDDWRGAVAEDVARARGLGLDLVRYDLYHELLENSTSLERLDQAVLDIRAAGLDVMLGLPGTGRWEDENPTFEGMVEVVVADTMLAVGRWSPAWVCPFVEPNGRLSDALGDTVPVRDWATAIDALGEQVRAEGNGTRLLVEIAVEFGVEDGQGVELVRSMSAPGMSIDAIGLGLSARREGELRSLEDMAGYATNASLGLWVSSFGAEAAMVGERAQARAVAAAVALASGRLNATGLCVRSLMDDTPLPSNFGLVGRDGSPRESFYALRDAIREVHWNG